MKAFKFVLITLLFFFVLPLSAQNKYLFLGKESKKKKSDLAYHAWYGEIGYSAYLGLFTENTNNPLKDEKQRATPLFSHSPSIGIGSVWFINENYVINHLDVGLTYSAPTIKEQFELFSENDSILSSATQSLSTHNIRGVFKVGNQYFYTQKKYVKHLLTLEATFSLGSGSNTQYLSNIFHRNPNNYFVSFGYEFGLGFVVKDRFIIELSISAPLITMFKQANYPVGQEYINTIHIPFYLSIKFLYTPFNKKCPTPKVDIFNKDRK